MNRQTDEWIERWTYRQMNRQKDGQTYEWIEDRWTDKQTDLKFI